MAQNKGAIVRYRTIDRCLRNRTRQYGIPELIDECSRALTEAFSVPMQVSRRQIYSDLNYMESNAGYQADIEHIHDGRKVYFRYADPNFSIEKMPLSDSELDQLKETILMLNRFKGMPHFEWMEEILSKLEDTFHLKGTTESVIGFEQNIDLKGIEYITPLFEAIVGKQVLTIQYRSFKSAQSTNFTIHPYYLKQYNDRWFLFGLTSAPQRITNLALDRIESISIDHNVKYIDKPQDLDFEEYFDDVIGVTIPQGKLLEHIVMRFTPDRYPYIKNKPLHPSQHNYDNDHTISIDVIPNKELIALLLSFGSQMEVVEPQAIRDTIREQVNEMNKLYS